MRRHFVDFQDEVERRNRLNLYAIARIGRKPEHLDVETKLAEDLSNRRETVIALDCSSESYFDTFDALADYSYTVLLDPPFEQIWQRLSFDPRYSQLVRGLGREGLYRDWKRHKVLRERAELVLNDPHMSILEASRLVLHCFFT